MLYLYFGCFIEEFEEKKCLKKKFVVLFFYILDLIF